MLSPFAAEAAEPCDYNSSRCGQHQMNPDKIAQTIVDTFGVSKEND